MQNIKNYSIIAILSLSLIAGIFSNIPLSYSQNDTMSMTNMTTEAEEEEHRKLLKQVMQRKKKKRI